MIEMTDDVMDAMVNIVKTAAYVTVTETAFKMLQDAVPKMTLDQMRRFEAFKKQRIERKPPWIIV